MRERLRALGGSLVRSWQLSLACGLLTMGALVLRAVNPDMWWMPFGWLAAVLYVGYRAALQEANDLAPFRVWGVGSCAVGAPLMGLWADLAHRGLLPPPADLDSLFSAESAALPIRLSNRFTHDAILSVGFFVGMLTVGAWGKNKAIQLADERAQEAEESS